MISMNEINGNPEQFVREKLASMNMTERSQLKLGYEARFGSRIVVYGECYPCKRQRCEYAVNGTLKCPDKVQ